MNALTCGTGNVNNTPMVCRCLRMLPEFVMELRELEVDSDFVDVRPKECSLETINGLT